MRKITTTIHLYEEDDYNRSEKNLEELCPRIRGYMELYRLEGPVREVCRKILSFQDLKATSFSDAEMLVLNDLAQRLGEIDGGIRRRMEEVFIEQPDSKQSELPIETPKYIERKSEFSTVPSQEMLISKFKEDFKTFMPYTIDSKIDGNGYTEYEFRSRDYYCFIVKQYNICKEDTAMVSSSGKLVLRQKLNYILGCLVNRRAIKRSKHGHFVYKDKTNRIGDNMKIDDRPSWLNN
tara:strand:+ start:114 stop:821 length:708 start_codon:yes stop_codon:yes gene_type:complete